MRSISKNILYTFLTQIPTVILGIITGVFTTRILGPEGKGVYAMFVADTELLVMFFGFSINSAIVYFISGKRLLPKSVAGISLFILLFALIFTSLLNPLLYFNDLGYTLLPKGVSLVIFILLIFTVFSTLLNTVITGFLQAYKYFTIINKIAILNSIINIVVYGTLYYVNKVMKKELTINDILLVYTLILIINSTFYIGVYLKKIKIIPTLRISFRFTIKPFFEYMITGHLSQLVNFLNYRLDLWIMNYYLSKEDIGYYALAAGLAGFVLFFTTPIVNVLTPYLIEYKQKKQIEYFKLFSKLNFTLTFIIGVILFILSELLIPLMYGEDFQKSILLFRILVIGSIITATTKVFASLNIANNKLNINLIATIVGLLLTVIFGLALIPVYKAKGAALTSVIAYLGVLIVVVILQLKNKIINIDNYYIFGKNDFVKIRKIYNGR